MSLYGKGESFSGEPENKERKEETLDSFFEELGPDKCRKIEAVAIEKRPASELLRTLPKYCNKSTDTFLTHFPLSLII